MGLCHVHLFLCLLFSFTEFLQHIFWESMQSHFILVLLFSILCVLSQPGDAFFREGRTLDVENKAFPKRSHFKMANIQRSNDVDEVYPVTLIGGKCEKDSVFVLKSDVNENISEGKTQNYLFGYWHQTLGKTVCFPTVCRKFPIIIGLSINSQEKPKIFRLHTN